MAARSASSRALTDHNEIRLWAEERQAKPSCVRGTDSEDDIGMIRLDFPGYSGGDSLEEIGWDDWFRKFDENNLVLLVQEETADGAQSNFNKLVSRETAQRGASRRSANGASGRSSRGRTASARSGKKTAGRNSSRRQTVKGGRSQGARSGRGQTRSAQGRAKTQSGSREQGGSRARRSTSVRGQSKSSHKKAA